MNKRYAVIESRKNFHGKMSVHYWLITARISLWISRACNLFLSNENFYIVKLTE